MLVGSPLEQKKQQLCLETQFVAQEHRAIPEGERQRGGKVSIHIRVSYVQLVQQGNDPVELHLRSQEHSAVGRVKAN